MHLFRVLQRWSQTASATLAPCGFFEFVHIRVSPIPKETPAESASAVVWRRAVCRADCAVDFTSQVGWKTQRTGPWACMKSPHLGATSTGLSAPLSCRFCCSSQAQCLSTQPACHHPPHVVVPPLYPIPVSCPVQLRYHITVMSGANMFWVHDRFQRSI